MRAAWLVAKWEYGIRIRSKFFLISTVLMPLLIVGMMFLPLLLMESEEVQGLTIAIVDETGEWAERIGQLLDEEYTRPDGSPRYPRLELHSRISEQQRAEASALLEAGMIDAYLRVESSFIETGEVTYYARQKGRIFEQEQLRQTVQHAWTQAAFQHYQVSPELMKMLQQDIAWSSYAVTGEGYTQSSELQAFLTPIIYVMILFFAVFFTSQTLMRSIITERSNRVVEILLSSITSQDLMTGKILGLGLIGLTQVAIYLVVMSLAGVGRGIDIITMEGVGYFLLYAVLGYFFYAAIYVSVGSLFETEQEAQQVVGLMSLIPILPLVFSSFVITHPDDLAVRVISFLPPLTPFLMIIRSAATDIPGWETAGTAFLMFACTLFMMRWAGTIFRTAILLYGKRITLPEIVRWLKAGS